MKSGEVIAGVLAGVAAGAVMGILFAPESGVKARKHIMDQGGDYADALKGKFGELVDSITQKFEASLKEAEDMVCKNTPASVHHLLQEAKDGISKHTPPPPPTHIAKV